MMELEEAKQLAITSKNVVEAANAYIAMLEAAVDKTFSKPEVTIRKAAFYSGLCAGMALLTERLPVELAKNPDHVKAAMSLFREVFAILGVEE